jgi:hypothetical protein
MFIMSELQSRLDTSKLRHLRILGTFWPFIVQFNAETAAQLKRHAFFCSKYRFSFGFSRFYAQYHCPHERTRTAIMGGLALYLLYFACTFGFAIYTHVSCSDFLYLYSTHWVLTVLLLVGVLNIFFRREEWVASKWLDEI